MEDYHLIAEFMGLETKRRKSDAKEGEYYWLYLKEIDEQGNRHYELIEYLRYLDSWDSLMPVISKTRKIDFEVHGKKQIVQTWIDKWNICKKRIDEGLLNANIVGVYNATKALLLLMKFAPNNLKHAKSNTNTR